MAQLQALDEEFSGEFGWSVALQDGVAVITDNYYDGTALNTGRAYAFTPDGAGGWEKDFTLEASDAALADYLGNQVTISEQVVLVGATGDDDEGSGAGAAYVFALQIEEDPTPVPAMGGRATLFLAAAASGVRCLAQIQAADCSLRRTVEGGVGHLLAHEADEHVYCSTWMTL